MSSLGVLAGGRGHHGASGKGLVWNVLSQALFHIHGALPKSQSLGIRFLALPVLEADQGQPKG